MRLPDTVFHKLYFSPRELLPNTDRTTFRSGSFRRCPLREARQEPR